MKLGQMNALLSSQEQELSCLPCYRGVPSTQGRLDYFLLQLQAEVGCLVIHTHGIKGSWIWTALDSPQG